MNFKPGDKVWAKNEALIHTRLAEGVYAAVIIRDVSIQMHEVGWWAIELVETPGTEYFAYRTQLTPRSDPPPQQEPKQQREPTWDDIERSPIAAAITYNLYNVSGTNAQLLLSGISGLSNVRSMLSTATYCYALTAVVNGMESAFSNSVSFVVSSPAPVKPTPNPPTQVVCSVNCASSN